MYWSHGQRLMFHPDKLRRTLLHEMCHAAAWVIDHTSSPPHGSSFKKWYRVIQIPLPLLTQYLNERARLASQKYPELQVTVTHNYLIQYKHKWNCLRCGKT